MNKADLWSHPPDSPISFARDQDKPISKPVLVTSVPRGRKVPGIPSGSQVVPWHSLYLWITCQPLWPPVASDQVSLS